MWWLPVFGWAFVLTAVFIFAWLSLARSRYYNKVERAQILQTKIPEKPWYVKMIDVDWRKFKR